MRALAITLGLLSSVAFGAAPARADIPGPYDQHCALELQERDGSECEECSSSVQSRMAGEPDPCAALEARGLVRRCSRGATVSYSVYCDRAGDYVVIAGGSRTEDPTGPAPPASCACRAAGARSRGWIAIAAFVAIAVALRASTRAHRRSR